MPLPRKLSLAAMLCLSVAMIVVALVRLVGTVVTTKADSLAAAPVWSFYWAVIEACIALIMTSVITIRGVFVTQPDSTDGRRRQQDSTLWRFGRQLLSSLRSGLSLRSLRRSRPQQTAEPKSGSGSDTPPKIATQQLTRASFGNVMGYGENSMARSESQTELRSVDASYIMEDLNYHGIRKNEVRNESV
ncbi:uncharacterized protein PG998_007156 [Apiospora kogelbergensis]|uniref:uncharacterized protein n=1 Tax=Apiospora kogelbergensis TaxID=1337665 RepID=UPI00312FF823